MANSQDSIVASARLAPANDRERLTKCARAVQELHWTGATHAFDITDDIMAPWFGAESEIFFDAARRARRGRDAVFLHRTRRKAILRILVRKDGDGWIVKTPRSTQRLDGKIWSGGYRTAAIRMPAWKRMARIRAGGAK